MDSSPSPGVSGADPRTWYESRIALTEATTRELEGQSRKLSAGRGISFVVGVGALLFLETAPRSIWPVLLGVGGAGLGLFLVLLARHRRVRHQLRRTRIRTDLAREGIARLDRNWEALPLPDLGPLPPHHPWAEDLDVVGRASLNHLLGTVSTDPGRAALRQALLDPLAPPPSDPLPWLAALAHAPPAPPPSFPSARSDPEWRLRRDTRAEAAREWAGYPRFLEELRLLGRESEPRRGPSATASLAPFVRWASGPPWTRHRGWILPVGRVLAVTNPLLLGLWMTGHLSLPFWVLGGIASLLLYRAVESEARDRFDAAEAAEGSVGGLAALLEAAETLPGQSSGLAALRRALAGQAGVPPYQALRRLRRLSDWAGIRRSALAHLPLVALFGWDLHLMDLLDRWREQHGSRVQDWLLAIGEVELIAAFALLQFDHPDWGAAEVQIPGEAPAGRGLPLSVRALRHPLLKPDGAISNDLEVPSPGQLLLVTGSNMSGKSTLLRSLGTNQILALAGAPVAALEFRTSAALPWTVMRIRDSLAQGVSFFLAELQRLHQVVEAARGAPVLVLLDEILQGTNSLERRIAARTILRHLLRTQAVGAVSTHDLTLAGAPDLSDRLVEIHLREEVQERDGRRTLYFDHRIRTGPATSRNALILLEMVGLGAHPDDPQDDPPEAPTA